MFVLVFALPVFAQFETAALVGTVVDSTGGAVADATITATNVDTGVSQTRLTDARGSYEFVTLRIGTYVVTAERQGFAISVADNVRLAVGARQRVDLSMQLGQLTERVEVSAVSSPLETDTSDRSQVIREAQIKALPLNGREYSALAADDRRAPSARVRRRVLHALAYASCAGEGQPGASTRPIGLDQPDRGDAGSGRSTPPLRSRGRVAISVRDVCFPSASPRQVDPSSLYVVRPGHRQRRPPKRRGCSHPPHGVGDALASALHQVDATRDASGLQPMMIDRIDFSTGTGRYCCARIPAHHAARGSAVRVQPQPQFHFKA
jgi:hypothetical protein